MSGLIAIIFQLNSNLSLFARSPALPLLDLPSRRPAKLFLLSIDVGLFTSQRLSPCFSNQGDEFARRPCVRLTQCAGLVHFTLISLSEKICCRSFNFHFIFVSLIRLFSAVAPSSSFHCPTLHLSPPPCICPLICPLFLHLDTFLVTFSFKHFSFLFVFPRLYIRQSLLFFR